MLFRLTAICFLGILHTTVLQSLVTKSYRDTLTCIIQVRRYFEFRVSGTNGPLRVRLYWNEAELCTINQWNRFHWLVSDISEQFCFNGNAPLLDAEPIKGALTVFVNKCLICYRPRRSTKAAELPERASQNNGCKTGGRDLIMQY